MPGKELNSPHEAVQYVIDATNHLRRVTGLPPVRRDNQLDIIGHEALQKFKRDGSVHQYCITNVCPNWNAENFGSVTNPRLDKGIQNILCLMMAEPKGTGHRGIIENPDYTRLGVGFRYWDSVLTLFQEFGL